MGCGESQQYTPAEAELREAAWYGNIEAVKQHLAAGTDVNAKASRGWTPLHSVATKEIAELLIAEGADVNAKTKSGRTPLDMAYEQSPPRTEMADLLRKHGGKSKKQLEAAGN